MTKESKKPFVQVTGEDGNAFFVLAKCQRAARRAGWSPDEINAFREKATAGNYDQLLAVVMEYFDVG